MTTTTKKIVWGGLDEKEHPKMEFLVINDRNGNSKGFPTRQTAESFLLKMSSQLPYLSFSMIEPTP